MLRIFNSTFSTLISKARYCFFLEKRLSTAPNDEQSKTEENRNRHKLRKAHRTIRKLVWDGEAEHENLMKAKQEELRKLRKSLGLVESAEERGILQRAKGARDFHPHSVRLRNKIIQRCTAVFEAHSAQPLDTPVFELSEVLNEKYGDAQHSKNFVYNLKDHGGELLSLRYDMTVPFARYLVNNQIKRMKRYQFGKVYRKETHPSLHRGRLREFLQADFDIAGNSDPMIPEAECLIVVCKILFSIGLRNMVIKVNHRSILKGIFDLAGISEDSRRKLGTLLDSLDKKSWTEICSEAQERLNITASQMDTVHSFIFPNDGQTNEDVLHFFRESSPCFAGTVDEIQQLLRYCSAYGLAESLVQFDPALVRGLDYYTGAVFEVSLPDSKAAGAIAAGGRYDDLVRKLSPRHDFHVPCVGISIGVDRILSVVEQKQHRKKQNTAHSTAQVYVCSAHKGLCEARLKLSQLLWDANIKAETSQKADPSLLGQFQYAERNKIPLTLVVGENELEKEIVIIRDMETRAETSVPRSRLVNELRKRFVSDQWILK